MDKTIIDDALEFVGNIFNDDYAVTIIFIP